MGQGWFDATNCQFTEKVSGRFFPNLYQENCLLLTHHFVYDKIFVMIFWTVPQSHPFPQPAIAYLYKFYVTQLSPSNLLKFCSHIVHNSLINNWSDHFQHYCYFVNKSYNCNQYEFQNEKFEVWNQNLLELRLDVKLQCITMQRAKVYKTHKLWVMHCKRWQ